jgi:DNA-binding CsgD family transcriptional regulator
MKAAESNVKADGSPPADLLAVLAELQRRVELLEAAFATRPATPPALTLLSRAERAIVERVLAGRTNEQIALDLHYSPKTVEWTLTKVYRKLRVRSRTELAAKLAKAHWV